MKKTLYFIIILISFSCQTDTDKSKRIYDEYIDSYYSAYRLTRHENLIIEKNWIIGDTLKFYTGYHLAPLKDSFNIDETIDIPENSELIIYDIINRTYFLKFVNDSTLKGSISKKELDFKLMWNLASKKWDFYESEKENIRMNIDSIMIKYGLSEDEFMEIMVEENYRRTGRKTFYIEL